MRVTSSMYYKSLYSQNNSQLNTKLFDVNKQIASGLKIQYAKDDISTFTETMRLDNEITTLEQIKQSTQSAYKISNQTDYVLNEFETNMNRMRTLLLQAANGTNSDTSLDAIADELRGIEKGLVGLANTSINGQYLFSGSAVDIKPISDDGTYNGNDVSMNAFVGSRNQQEFNITGAELFLGEEIIVRREVTTNVAGVLNAPADPLVTVPDINTTMEEFMGDIGAPNDHYFYLRGTASDGSAIKEKIQMTDANTMDDLLTQIGYRFGNTAGIDVVNVKLNDFGQIVIEDKMKGSSKIDFHLVGATDFSGGGAANVNDINLLDATGSTDYAVVTATPGIYIKEFVKSPITSAVTGGTINDSILYDRTQFSQDGPKLSSNAPQILKEDNSFAKDSTKLHEVFTGITYNADGTYASGLDTKILKLEGTNTSGVAYDVSINLLDAGSTFTDNVSGLTYDIFNIDTTRVATPAADVTYKQLMDVVNMTVTGNLPLANTDVEYDNAIEASNFNGGTYLTHDGKINFEDVVNMNTSASIAIYDPLSDDFSTTVGALATFNTNNALTVRDPKTDFFKTIREMVLAVENHKTYPDSSSGDLKT